MKVHVATYSDTCKSIQNEIKGIENKNVVVRLGGTMPYEKYPIQINSLLGTEISIDKLVFNKLCNFSLKDTYLIFNELTIDFFIHNINQGFVIDMYKPIISDKGKFILKPYKGSGGKNINISKYFLTKPYLKSYLNKVGPFIIQPYINVTSEYRIHVTFQGLHKVTKKIKNNQEDLFITRDSHKVLDINNPNVVKPRLLEQMINACVITCQNMGMDIMCFDVIYNSQNKDNHHYYIVESNTGPELIGSTRQWYIDRINELIELKNKN
jgi:hypothetical protein